MKPPAGPSLLSLALRSLVLLGLIGQAAWLYGRYRLSSRGWWSIDPARLEERVGRFAARFVRVATQFRGGLIKLGQVASLRVDVIPEAMTAELARLQDRVPPHPFEEIAAQIESELGRPAEEAFARIEPQALASASLGQVHRATDRQGREVAVKVLYPGVERSVAVDLRMTRLALWLFDRVLIADLMQVYAQLAASLLGEMDYEREGRAAEEIARNLASDPELFAQIRIPRIDWETTSRRVLTMEFIDGDKINDRAALEARGVDLEEAVARVTRAFLHMMFKDRFFHCDPHPGNLMIDTQGRVAIVDFGMNQRVAAEVMDGIRMNVLAAVTRNEDLWVDSMIRVGIIDESDREVARELARMSFDPTYYNLTPREITELDFAAYFAEMRRHMSRVRSFRLPDGLVSWSRAFSLLYGLALELAPGLRPLDVIGPYVLEFLQGGALAASDSQREGSAAGCEVDASPREAC
jgi:predicted unusual protein kinase regulating ubiquinone biosynthesis (AarF/ABC1/UbiB family)